MTVQNIPNKYLILDEESNAVDYLIRSSEFLSQVEQNRMNLKWFIIAFHGALHSFMILALLKVNADQIFKDRKHTLHPKDRNLLSFLQTYSLLKSKDNTAGNPFISTDHHDLCMKELNDKLRNLMIHFRPMVWASEPWYPARACYPLIDVLKYCIDHASFRHTDRAIILAHINGIQELLNKYREQEE